VSLKSLDQSATVETQWLPVVCIAALRLLVGWWKWKWNLTCKNLITKGFLLQQVEEEKLVNPDLACFNEKQRWWWQCWWFSIAEVTNWLSDLVRIVILQT